MLFFILINCIDNFKYIYFKFMLIYANFVTNIYLQVKSLKNTQKKVFLYIFDMKNSF